MPFDFQRQHRFSTQIRSVELATYRMHFTAHCRGSMAILNKLRFIVIGSVLRTMAIEMLRRYALRFVSTHGYTIPALSNRRTTCPSLFVI